MLTCFCLIVVALARPRMGFKWQEKNTGGIDLLIAVDVSKSMFASDLNPNRLERAKREILDLLRLLKGDRVGFLPFAGRSFIHLPLTDDYKMARLFLENINNDLISAPGTNIAEAIDLGVTSLTKSAAHNSEGKAIILITDGEDHSGKLFDSAKAAKEKGIRVFVVGIGSPEGAPLLLPDGSYLKDSAGNVVVSKLAENDLVKVAETTGGIYVRSVAGDIDLEKIYLDGIKPSSENNPYGESRQKIWNEIYQWPLGLSLACLVAGFLLTPYRRLVALYCLIIFSGMYPEISEASIFKKENDDFLAGAKLLKEGKNDEAVSYFLKNVSSKDRALAHASLFNLGNIAVNKGELDSALEYYKKAYAVDDTHVPTIENMKWVHDQLNRDQNQENQNQEKPKPRKPKPRKPKPRKPKPRKPKPRKPKPRKSKSANKRSTEQREARPAEGRAKPRSTEFSEQR